MNIETKAFDVKASVAETDPQGVVHAVVSIFTSQDSVGDTMVKGAFARSIKAGKESGKLPPGVWAHDWNRPVAKTLDAWETDEGLNVIAQFNLETQDGRDAFSNVKNGLFNEYSFGFSRIKDGEEKKDGTNYVKDVNWFEWSPVLVGAHRDTYTAGVKQYDTEDLISYSEIERRLRDVGLSQKASKIWITGLKALYQRDVEEAQAPAEAQPPAPEPEPTPEPECKTEETPPAKTEPQPIETAAPVVMDLSAAIHQAQVQALYADFQRTQARLGLR